MTLFFFKIRRLLAFDKRAEPRPGERVPYVIVYGTPGLPLIQLVKRYTCLIDRSTALFIVSET